MLLDFTFIFKFRVSPAYSDISDENADDVLPKSKSDEKDAKKEELQSSLNYNSLYNPAGQYGYDILYICLNANLTRRFFLPPKMGNLKCHQTFSAQVRKNS